MRSAAVLATALLTLTAVGLLLRRLWPQLEPARVLPLPPTWPWQLPRSAPDPAPVPLQRLTPGWSAVSAGNPAAWRYPACWQSLPRTPWDLALADGLLLAGLGNDANRGPTANAGPVPLFALQLDNIRWQWLATLPEEQIKRFVRQGRELWILGADGRGSSRWGNLYRHRDGAALWWQVRRLPRFVHVHDLTWWRGRMLVAGNVPDAVNSGPPSERHGSALADSADGGRHWRVQRLPGWRATALLPLQRHLYALEAHPGPRLRRWLLEGGRWPRFSAVWQWLPEGRWRPLPGTTPQMLLPGVAGAGARFAWIDGVMPSPEGAAWIASLGAWQADPPRRAAFVARETAAGQLRVLPVPLPAGSQAMDLQRQERGWLLLSARRLGTGAWRSSVTRVSLDGDRLRQLPVLSFEAPLPGWSLAGGGRWFVGLGHALDRPEPSPGTCRAADRFSGSVLLLRQVAAPAGSQAGPASGLLRS